MSLIIRLREDERNPIHCRVSVFSALEGPTAGHSGVLVLDTALWDELRRALSPPICEGRLLGRVELTISPEPEQAPALASPEIFRSAPDYDPRIDHPERYREGPI